MTTKTDMATTRRYTAAEIIELTQVLGASGDIDPVELRGMEKLAKLLKHLETMTDADIAEEVRLHFRSV